MKGMNPHLTNKGSNPSASTFFSITWLLYNFGIVLSLFLTGGTKLQLVTLTMESIYECQFAANQSQLVERPIIYAG